MSTLYGKQKILSLQFLILLINIFTLFSSLNLLNLKFLNFKHIMRYDPLFIKHYFWIKLYDNIILLNP